jgi:hypothetical protein
VLPTNTIARKLAPEELAPLTEVIQTSIERIELH